MGIAPVAVRCRRPHASRDPGQVLEGGETQDFKLLFDHFDPPVKPTDFSGAGGGAAGGRRVARVEQRDVDVGALHSQVRICCMLRRSSCPPSRSRLLWPGFLFDACPVGLTVCGLAALAGAAGRGDVGDAGRQQEQRRCLADRCDPHRFGLGSPACHCRPIQRSDQRV